MIKCYVVYNEVLVVIIIIVVKTIVIKCFTIIIKILLFEEFCTFLSFISKIKNIIKESGIFCWYFLNNCTIC